MEHITEFSPAFDKRSENYGIHGVELRMILKGTHGVAQFILFTNWHLPHVTKELRTKEYLFCQPLPVDLGYHSPIPLYEGQNSITTSCKYLDGKECYYDGSLLDAERIYNVLLANGSAGVWKALEEYYVEVFGELK